MSVYDSWRAKGWTKACNTFWGSHGCDGDLGHDGDHECGTRDPEGVCSQFRRTIGPETRDGDFPGAVRFCNVGWDEALDQYDPAQNEWDEWHYTWTGFN